MSDKNGLQQHKTDMNRFKPPTLENDSYSKEIIKRMNQFTRRANYAYDYVRRNGVPQGYEKRVARYNEAFKRANIGSLVNFEEVYALDQAIARTVYDNDTFAKLPIPTTVLDRPRFQIKDYLVQSENKPLFTRDFHNPSFLRLKSSAGWTEGVGLYVGIAMTWSEIAESQGGLWDPLQILMEEAAFKMGIQKSRRGFLGTACQDAYSDDGGTAANWGITGIYNYASKQTFASGIGADENVQDQGDIEFSLRTAFTDLVNVKQAGQYIIVSSGGYAAHMFYERDGYTQQLDLVRVKEFLSHMGGASWFISNQCYAAAMDATHQTILLLKAAPTLIEHKIIYGTQLMPLASKMYEADNVEVLLFADAIQFKKVDTTLNAVPITVNNAACTADGVGFLPEGLKIL